MLAHELGHWKLGHTICTMIAGSTVMLLEFSLFSLFRGSRHLLEEFGFVEVQPVIMSLTLFMMVLGPVDSFIGWLFKLLSRRCDVFRSCSVIGFMRACITRRCACQYLRYCTCLRMCITGVVSCRYEFQADGFAVSLKHATKLSEALKILDKENKSDFVVDSLYSQYHYSHPPLSERLRAINAAAKKML